MNQQDLNGLIVALAAIFVTRIVWMPRSTGPNATPIGRYVLVPTAIGGMYLSDTTTGDCWRLAMGYRAAGDLKSLFGK
jgi:hypothetical protein